MKTKIEKGLRYLAAGIFFVALLLNVKFTLDSPYFLTGNELVAQTTGTGTSTGTGDVWDFDVLIEEGQCYKCEYVWPLGTVESLCECTRYTHICMYGGSYSCEEDHTVSWGHCTLTGNGC